MARGGYQILDMKNIPITIGVAKKIPGVYETLEGAYRKAVLLSNLVLEVNGISTYEVVMPDLEVPDPSRNTHTVECFDRFVVFGLNQGKFVSQISIDGDVILLKMTIDDNDMVKVEYN